MTYATELAAVSRTPVTLVEMDLGACSRTFGVDPCNATGVECYNTKGTCQYPTAYNATTNTLRFVSADAPLPFTGARPYVKGVSYVPTEIKTSLTVNGRATVELYDEPDADIGVDPYLSARLTTTQGTYWRKLLARNPHTKGRQARISQGFLGLAIEDFAEVWRGRIDNITIQRGTVRVEIVDPLKRLDAIEVPAKLDIKLVTDITAVVTTITLTSITGLDSPSGVIRVEDELISYTAISATNNQISGCTRGAYSTTAATHDASDKVGRVRVYAKDNPFDILLEMLETDAGIAEADIDTTAFADCKAFPGGEMDMRAVIVEPTKLSDLYFELVDLLDCRSWVGEDLKITLRRNLQNRPGRSHAVVTDEANIVQHTPGVDLNQKSRVSRVLLYWDKPILGAVDEYKDYHRLDVAIDADAENAVEYGEVAEKVIGCRWLYPDLTTEERMAAFVRTHTTRRVWMQRDPLPLLTLGVELKDSGILTGGYVDLTTDELCDVTGAPLAGIWEVVKRDAKGGTVTLTMLRCKPALIGYVAANDAPDYADATTTHKREYAYVTDSLGQVTGASGYYLW